MTLILQALATDDYSGAARAAAERLGLDSAAAGSCKPAGANSPPPVKGSMDEMMALHMPEQMRRIGLAMHTAASNFAVVTSQAAATHDMKAAVDALSQVTQYCVTCHQSYRIDVVR